MKRRGLVLLTLGLGLVLAPLQATEEKPAIGFAGGEKFPLKGQPVQVLVSHGSYPDLEKFEVSVTYRPNSEVTRTEKLGHPDDMGKLMWTPQDAGICVIKAEAPDPLTPAKMVAIEKNVSVRFGQFPLAGLLVMLVAGLTLFGGAIVSYLRLNA